MPQGPIFRTLLIFYAALLWGLLSLLGVAYFLHSQGGALADFPPEMLQMLSLGVGLTNIGLGAAAIFLKKMRHDKAATATSVAEKAEIFRVATLIGLAMCEGGALLACVMFLLSGSANFIASLAPTLFGFYVFRPFVSRMVAEMNLSPAEAEEAAKL